MRRGRNTLEKIILLVSVFLLMSLPAASAQRATYFAMKPDSEICIQIVFGDHGRGEYTFLIEDPDYPGQGWVDIHRTNFNSGPNNPVINPVCFNSYRRKVGDEALLKLTLETPDEKITYDYGICVSDHEDVDVVESAENPCDTTSGHTDLFSIGLLESERYAKPGEKVTFFLMIQSDMDLTIAINKESGPTMTLSRTTVEMPGVKSVEIQMDAPSEPDDYPFTIGASVNNCQYPSCQKRVRGVLHVAEESILEGFSVELSPRNINVIGVQSATYFLTVRNFEKEQDFKIDLKIDAGLRTVFNTNQVRIGRHAFRKLDIDVVPNSGEHKLYSILVTVENEAGEKRAVNSYLTVNEPASDAQRMSESDPVLRDDADNFEERFEEDGTLGAWQDFQRLTDTKDGGDGDDQPPEGPGIPLTWIVLSLVVVAIVVVVFYLFKKTQVVEEGGSSYFQ